MDVDLLLAAIDYTEEADGGFDVVAGHGANGEFAFGVEEDAVDAFVGDFEGGGVGALVDDEVALDGSLVVESEDGVDAGGGVKAGEKIVTTGGFILKSEMLKGQLGEE